MAGTLLDAWEGPAASELVADAPALEPEPPATFAELLDLIEREISAAVSWDQRLVERVRAGEVSIECAVSAVATYTAERVHNRHERDRKYWDRAVKP